MQITSAGTPKTVVTPRPAPPETDVAAVVIGRDSLVWGQDGKAVEANAGARGIKQKVKDFLLPSDLSSVSDDYKTYRVWHGLSNASNSVVGFLGTQGLVTGMAAALGHGLPFIGGAVAALGLAPLVTYALKGGLNWVGTLVGGNMAKNADEDPAKWMKVSSNVQTAATAAQAVLVAVPGAFLALAPLTGLTQSWAGSVQGSSKVKIQQHQAHKGLAELAGKDNNQDLVSSSIGSVIGAVASVAGHALLVPVLGPFAPLAVVPAAIAVNRYANRKASESLTFDNLTQTGVAKMAHQVLEGKDVPAPRDMARKELKLPKRQADVVLGDDGRSVFSNPVHRDEILSLYGDSRYLLDYDGKKVVVTLGKDADDKDLMQAAWQGQLMAEVVGSDGFKKLADETSPEDALRKANAMTLAVASHLEPQIESLKEKGWNLEQSQIRAKDVRVEWKTSAHSTPLAEMKPSDLKQFMQTGSVPEGFAA